MPNFKFLEVHAVDHCNNNCRWCHNYSPFSPQKEYEARDYFEGLDFLRAKKIEVEKISLMGGEPFLHSDITQFAFHLFERYQTQLVITTNGFWLSEDTIKDHKDLWKLLTYVKISRYPNIEKRLGGEKRFYELISSIKNYNPSIMIDFPDKGRFRELEFHEDPVEPTRFCGNSHCTALLPDMKIGRCGAGSYAHFAPEGMLSEAFKNNKHMIYDLRKFDSNSFNFWKERYPLDACSYCSFSTMTHGNTWKVERGRAPFNKTYELEYHYTQGRRRIGLNRPDGARQKAGLILEQYGEKPEVHMLNGLAARQQGDAASALNSFAQVLQLDPNNREAQEHIHSIRKNISHSHAQ